MRIMILFTWMFLAQMMASQVDASPVIISQTGPGTGSWTTGAQESNAVSWVSSFAFSDVKIFATLSGVGVGTAYLTTQIGPTTTAADLLAIAPFTANSTTGPEWVGLFSGLTLEPGTYFLTLGSLEDAFCCGWGNTFSPNIVTAPGVTYNGSYFTTNPLPVWLRPLVVVAMHTGMRRGELLGLRWEDVDLNSGQLRIRRDKAGDGRWVALNSEALGALRAAKRRSVASPLVFCTPEGRNLTLNFKRHWQPAVKAAGLADFRFHDLRHTFASRLVARGVSSYIVQHAGGWRTASMMQRYAHLDPATIRAAVELLALPEARSFSQSGTDSGTETTEERPAEATVGV